MHVFGLSISRPDPWSRPATLGLSRVKSTDLITRLPTPGNNWLGSAITYVRERYAGAWQRGEPARIEDVMTHSTAWACITLAAFDIAKLRLKLVSEDADDICTEVTNPAYTPVLRKPNHYQNRITFIQAWIISKLTRGNTYVLKVRDGRGVVRQLYILDPARVQVLVAPDGSVYYQLSTDYLSGLGQASVTAPASEIIHDLYIALYHPLCGVSPIHACGRSVMQSLKIQQNSEEFFEAGSQPGGVLTAPASISADAAKRIQEHWDANFSGRKNAGKVAVLGDGLKYEPMAMTAVDAQLIDQLKWSDEKVCSAFHVPPYMVGVGSMPTYNNIEALNQQYYSQCLQALIESLELCLKEGLEIADPLYVESDLDGLLRMDSATKMESTTKGVRGGIFTPNDGRKRFNLRPLPGGDTVYLQEQDHSLDWLTRRDALPILPKPSGPAPPLPTKDHDLDEDAAIAFYNIRAKALGLPVSDEKAA